MNMTRNSRQQARKRKQTQQKETPPQVKPLPRGPALWLFRFAAVLVIPALLLLGIETGLRVFGYGVPTGFTFKQEVDDSTTVLSNPYFTWRFFPPRLAKEVSHFTLPSVKEEETYRVFVLGASAAQGVPAMAYGMSRMLGVMLRDQYPGVDFAVINAAITATNSHVVLPVARDCSRLESDLFIIYLGNNEVVGPYGAGTIFSPLVSNLSVIRAGIALKATRLGQLMRGIAGKLPGRGKTQPGRWRGMEMFLGHQVRASDPGMETVYRHFERNLVDICRVAQDSGIPAVVSTVGVNLKDCAPFASLHHPGLSEEETRRWQVMVREGETLQERGRYGDAVERYLQAESIDSDYAELHFRLGKCYWAMGDYEESKTRYVKARELDVLRFRADTRINGIIRRVAGGKSEKGIRLADSQQALEANSPHGTPGSELLYEHVHLNFRGTYLVARAILDEVQRVLPERVARYASGRAVLSEQACAQRLAYTGWNRLLIAKGLLRTMRGPPFSNQLGNVEQVRALSEKVDTLQARYTRREGREEAQAQYTRALRDHDTHYFLHDYYADLQYNGLGNAREAEKHLKIAAKQRPQSAEGLSLLGNVLYSQAKHEEAEAVYRRALGYNPRSTSLLYTFGTMLLERGRIMPAVKYLRKAVEIDPENAMAHSTLGLALPVQSDDQGSRREALRHLEEAVAIDPDNAQVRGNLAIFHYHDAQGLMKQGEGVRARVLLQQVVELAPDGTAGRYDLAVLFHREGNHKASVEQLSEILRIDPNHVNARKLLGLLRATTD